MPISQLGQPIPTKVPRTDHDSSGDKKAYTSAAAQREKERTKIEHLKQLHTDERRSLKARHMTTAERRASRLHSPLNSNNNNRQRRRSS